MIPCATDRLHELFINDAQRKMNQAFQEGDLDLAHEHANEFGRLIQNRSKEMAEYLEQNLSAVNYVSCIKSRRAGP